MTSLAYVELALLVVVFAIVVGVGLGRLTARWLLVGLPAAVASVVLAVSSNG